MDVSKLPEGKPCLWVCNKCKRKSDNEQIELRVHHYFILNNQKCPPCERKEEFHIKTVNKWKNDKHRN